MKNEASFLKGRNDNPPKGDKNGFKISISSANP